MKSETENREQADEMDSIVKALTPVERSHLALIVLGIARCFAKVPDTSTILISRVGPALRIISLNATEEESYNECLLATELLAEMLIPTTGEVH